MPGFEQAYARLAPDGVLELRVGLHSHGQGMETTLSQVANEVLGIHPDKVRVIHGDTAMTPYSRAVTPLRSGQRPLRRRRRLYSDGHGRAADTVQNGLRALGQQPVPRLQEPVMAGGRARLDQGQETGGRRP